MAGGCTEGTCFAWEWVLRLDSTMDWVRDLDLSDPCREASVNSFVLGGGSAGSQCESQ